MIAEALFSSLIAGGMSISKFGVCALGCSGLEFWMRGSCCQNLDSGSGNGDPTTGIWLLAGTFGSRHAAKAAIFTDPCSSAWCFPRAFFATSQPVEPTPFSP